MGWPGYQNPASLCAQQSTSCHETPWIVTRWIAGKIPLSRSWMAPHPTILWQANHLCDKLHVSGHLQTNHNQRLSLQLKPLSLHTVAQNRLAGPGEQCCITDSLQNEAPELLDLMLHFLLRRGSHSTSLRLSFFIYK